MIEKRFSLELNERQLRLVNYAIEEYFHIRMGQWGGLADDLAERGLDLSPDNPNHDRIFSSYLIHRDCAKISFEAIARMLWGDKDNNKTEEQLIAEDIYQVIRHTLWDENHEPGKDDWCGDAHEPINFSGEPLPKCRRVDDERIKEG